MTYVLADTFLKWQFTYKFLVFKQHPHNSEEWYNLKNEELEKLKPADESLLRRILESPVSTPKEIAMNIIRRRIS